MIAWLGLTQNLMQVPSRYAFFLLLKKHVKSFHSYPASSRCDGRVAVHGEGCLVLRKQMINEAQRQPPVYGQSFYSDLELEYKTFFLYRKEVWQGANRFPLMMWNCFCCLHSSKFLTLKLIKEIARIFYQNGIIFKSFCIIFVSRTS